MKNAILHNLVLLSLFAPCVKAAEIPINIGLGPAFYLIPEQLQEEETHYTGLSLHIKAVIDKEGTGPILLTN
ncbi:MAG: hypothetical protein HRU09_19135 [Oligoflexales bacterium]|nr:hypothetical protein [Oligoflexales bacterium]